MGTWDLFENEKEEVNFLGIIELSRVQKSQSLFSPHWCMLQTVWSNSGLHPPKMGTF
jgi:hypothetical protein